MEQGRAGAGEGSEAREGAGRGVEEGAGRHVGWCGGWFVVGMCGSWREACNGDDGGV